MTSASGLDKITDMIRGAANVVRDKVTAPEEPMFPVSALINMDSKRPIREDEISGVTAQNPVMKKFNIPSSFKDWKEKRYYQTGAYESPKDYMWFEDTYSPTQPNFKGKHCSDWVDKGKIEDVIRTANKFGIEPHYLAGVVMSESGVGNQDDDDINMGHVYPKAHPDTIKNSLDPSKNSYLNEIVKSTPNAKSIDDVSVSETLRAQGKFMLDTSAQELKKHLNRHPNDILSGMQEYSGGGKTLYGGRATGKFFGKNVKDIDLTKTKDQGHRALAFANIFKSHPEFNNILNEMKMNDSRKTGTGL